MITLEDERESETADFHQFLKFCNKEKKAMEMIFKGKNQDGASRGNSKMVTRGRKQRAYFLK
jgi:hypothetical protein